MTLSSAIVRLPALISTAPPSTAARESTTALPTRATVLLLISTAPPLSTPPPFASVIPLSRSRAPPSTANTREPPSASS
eukprot:754240-Prymnesium_polylepis.1